MNEKNSKKRISKVIENVDGKTGEILDRKFETYYSNQEPEYVKLYLNHICKLFDLTNKADKTLFSLLRKLNYDNEIVLTGNMKATMANELKIKKNTLEHAIGELVTKNIFFKQGNNQYLVNPHILARGRWQDIQKIIMQVEYSISGFKINTQFDTQKELPL